MVKILNLNRDLDSLGVGVIKIAEIGWRMVRCLIDRWDLFKELLRSVVECCLVLLSNEDFYDLIFWTMIKVVILFYYYLNINLIILGHFVLIQLMVQNINQSNNFDLNPI